MPYRVKFEMNLGGDQPEEGWSEKNKDEVIDRLVWILRSMEFEVSVTYPDGEVY